MLFKNFVAIPTDSIMREFSNKTTDRKVTCIDIDNELKAVDLYCYLYSKFGKPNGIQNFLRSDSSDNLIHWEWTLKKDSIIILIQGLSFRTEVYIFNSTTTVFSKDEIVKSIKSDYCNYGKEMSVIRSNLQKWTEFTNPYYRINSALKNSFSKINELNIDPLKDKVEQPKDSESYKDFKLKWDVVNEKYNFAI